MQKDKEKQGSKDVNNKKSSDQINTDSTELYTVNDSNVKMTSTTATFFGVVSDVRLRANGRKAQAEQFKLNSELSSALNMECDQMRWMWLELRRLTRHSLHFRDLTIEQRQAYETGNHSALEVE